VYIREGIDLVLRQYGHLLPGQLQLGSESPVGSAMQDAKQPPRVERGDRVSTGEPGVDRALGAGASKG
jgi:hypothetical protein